MADAYERGRPTYPAEAVRWLIDALRLGVGRVLVDVGAGTGKLTRALVPSGASVVAVEPVAAMRTVLERELPTVQALDGTAESLPLADGDADAIVVGQAFHWFDGPAALTEFHRVLAPGGRLALVWNMRDRAQELQRLVDSITEPLRRGTPSQSTGMWRGAFEDVQLFEPVAQLKVPFELEMDRETFVDRIGSISFIAALEGQEREEVMERVRRLADEHPERWAYVTEAYVYERSA